MNLVRLFILGVCWFAVSVHAEILRVGIVNDEKIDPKDPVYYFERLIWLALDKTRKTDGDFVLEFRNLNVSTDRTRALLIANKNASAQIDIIWASVNQERKKLMRLIPIDLLRGLNNYRLLLVKNGKQSRFAQVTSLEKLREFSVGGGIHWTDTEIMKANGFEVRTSTDYSSLIKMLAADRFDFVSRGLNEVFYDTERYQQYDLAIESQLLLKYEPQIDYSFFVNIENEALAQRIERGLQIAKKDGSWDKLFDSLPSLKQGTELLSAKNRTELIIKNPFVD